jgi:hypothetical protein
MLEQNFKKKKKKKKTTVSFHFLKTNKKYIFYRNKTAPSFINTRNE